MGLTSPVGGLGVIDALQSVSTGAIVANRSVLALMHLPHVWATMGSRGDPFVVSRLGYESFLMIQLNALLGTLAVLGTPAVLVPPSGRG